MGSLSDFWAMLTVLFIFFWRGVPCRFIFALQTILNVLPLGKYLWTLQLFSRLSRALEAQWRPVFLWAEFFQICVYCPLFSCNIIFLTHKRAEDTNLNEQANLQKVVSPSYKRRNPLIVSWPPSAAGLSLSSTTQLEIIMNSYTFIP